MARWKVEFTDEKNGTHTIEVDCHFAHNAPKVAIKELEGTKETVLLPGDFVHVVVTQVD